MEVLTVGISAHVKTDFTWTFFIVLKIGGGGMSKEAKNINMKFTFFDLLQLWRQWKNFMWNHFLHRLKNLLLSYEFEQVLHGELFPLHLVVFQMQKVILEWVWKVLIRSHTLGAFEWLRYCLWATTQRLLSSLVIVSHQKR